MAEYPSVQLDFLPSKAVFHSCAQSVRPKSRLLTEIIKQGIESGEISFAYPSALAEIVLIVLAVKFDNTLLPSSPEEMEETMRGLVTLLEKGTEVTPGTLSYLTLTPYIS